MSSNKNELSKLPEGWILCTSKSNPGRKYYFNRKTGKSSWTKPQDDDKSGHSKPKDKKEKTHGKEKKRKEESSKKNMKRKSDGSNEQSTFKKKRKDETLTQEKSKTKSVNPVKCTTTTKIDTALNSNMAENKLKTSEKLVEKHTPSKNTANKRLSNLRAELSEDLKKDEKQCSPVRSKISPKTSHTETKASKVESMSPNLTESKSGTTQSPRSDSIQSAPSPSQFLAANKIISSMKAQLPEQYCNKVKQKDTFADIEQGICNQTAEFPFMKHPSTPPQFSEATKLVSAIKSKLTYKATTKESPVKYFTSAKDRMEALRTRLSGEPMDTTVDSNEASATQAGDAMDIDFKEVKPTPSTDIGDTTYNFVLVVDTNIFIHELDFVKTVVNSHIKGYDEEPMVLVPWRVVNELDRLKDNNNGKGAVCKRARPAMDYLYKRLPENDRIKVQPLRDASSHIYPCEMPDDEILNCCLQQAERGKSVILLSNDKNLCNKACANGIKFTELGELKSLLESKPQPPDPDLGDSVKHYEASVYQLLANILENEMRAKYNNLWQHVLFKAPPWTLADVLQCLLKHWIAVFNEVFPRIEHLISDLKNTLASIESKDPKSLTKPEVSIFKELCLDIAKKCQIIPEYMELAKSTVERLQRKCASETHALCDKDAEMLVIEAFEGLWTIFSSYCAKLATGIGVTHNIEDKLAANDTMEVLVSKLAVFDAHIRALALAIQGILSVDSLESEEQISRLEIVFKDCLASLCVDSGVINKNNLRIFCYKCKNMLQEAYSKFIQLTELLQVCKTAIGSE